MSQASELELLLAQFQNRIEALEKTVAELTEKTQRTRWSLHTLRGLVVEALIAQRNKKR